MTAAITEVNDYRNDAATELERVYKAALDIHGNTRALQVVVPEGSQTLPDNDRIVAQLNTPQGDLRLRILGGAHHQFAERTGIPVKYYDRMLASQPQLLADNLNTWLQTEPKPRLLRALLPIDDDAQQANAAVGAFAGIRAMLSDRYRPLDNWEIMKMVLPELDKLGARVASYELDERRFHMRITNKDARTLEELRQQFNYNAATHRHENADGTTGDGFINEALCYGAVIRNSETGHAAFSVEPFFYIVRCLNGYVMVQNYRVAHLGGRTEAEEQFMQRDTKHVDDAATFLKARDHLVAAFQEASLKKSVGKIIEARGEPLQLPAEVPTFNFIEAVGAKFDFTQGEQDALKEEWTDELVNNGNQRNRFAVAQAVTATAKRATDANRRYELEKAGWKLLGSPLEPLIKAAKQATSSN